MISAHAYLSVILIGLSFCLFYTIRHYASKDSRLFAWHSYPTIFAGYYSCLAIVVIVPLDVSNTVIARRSVSYESDFENQSLEIVKIYVVFFLIGQIGYNVLTFQERYNKSGYFTVKTKVIDCLKFFARTYLMYLVMGAVFFGILVGTKVVDASLNAILVTMVLLSNTFGLALLMILLGYGLVSFPQMIWYKGDLNRQLSLAQQHAAYRFKALGDATSNMTDVCSSILRTEAELETHPSSDPDVNVNIKILAQEKPPEFKLASGKLASDENGKITVDSLAAVRSRLFVCRATHVTALGKVEQAKVNAYYYEDLLESMDRADGVKKIKWSFSPESTESEYVWHVRVKPILFRVCAVMAACMTVLSFLGVIGTMSGVGKSISVYATAVHDDEATATGICIFVIFTLLYPAYVTVWSIFQMKIASMMELVPSGGTTAPSLSVNCRAVIRLSTPLAFFYLGWIFENGTKNGSWLDGAAGGTIGDDDLGSNRILMAFPSFYQVQVIPVMGGGFNTIFPIIMFSVSAAVLFNVFNHVLVFCKLEKFQFGAEILTEAQLTEGKRQLTRHKNQMERKNARKGLREHIDGKHSSTKTGVVGGALTFLGIKKEVSMKTGNDKGDAPDEEDIEKGKIQLQDLEPPALLGWVEKKGQKKFGVSGGWQARYFNVVKPGLLVYYKDTTMEGVPNGTVKLGLVMNFSITTKKDDGDKDDNDSKVKLELDLADKTFKMRFADMEEATKWRNGLLAWKEYFVKNGLSYDDDVDAGPSSSVLSKDIFSAKENEVSETGSNEDETSRLTKNMQSSSYPLLDSSASFSMSISDRPADLQGWLEKKQKSKFGKMAQWQKRYFRVDEKSGSLLYYKTPNAGEEPAGSIDLKMIVDVAAAEKEGQIDAARFNIDLGEKVYKMRAASTAEGENWIALLNLWRDYIILK